MHPRAYLPYLLSLLHQPTAARVNEAAEIITGLISRQTFTDPHTLDVLCQLVAHRGSLVSSPRRNRLLRAIVSRIHTTFESHPFPDTRHTHDDTLSCNVHDLAFALTTVLSCTLSHSRLTSLIGQQLRRWAIDSIRHELQVDSLSHASVDSAWKKLQHLAAMKLRSPAADLMDTPIQPWSDWSAICILTQLERIADRRTNIVDDPPPMDDEIHAMVSRLWHAWSIQGASAEEFVSDAILASILHIAGDIKAHEIIHQYELHASQGRISVGLTARIEGYSAMLLCGHNPEQVVQAVLAEERPSGPRAGLLRDVLLRLLSRDVGLACTFYGTLENVLEEVPSGATCPFASTLR